LSSCDPGHTLPCRTCLHSASRILAVRISCLVTDWLCSQSLYLSIKFYHIYVCYKNITLHIAFSIICGFT
jgi:hypothetical protein